MFACRRPASILKQCPRCCPSSTSRLINDKSSALEDEGNLEVRQRRRKTEWKRRQRGQSFLDHVVIHVKGGTGGNGCVAFNREKFKPFGPPSGGDGGRGGDVYIQPTSQLTTLSTIPKSARAADGAHGQGTWQNGRAGAPLVLRVPVGTVVRELRRTSEETDVETSWVHYPGAEAQNAHREAFAAAQRSAASLERERRKEMAWRAANPVRLDLDRAEVQEQADDAPLGTRARASLGHLVASGGRGGLGNPHFLGENCRSPKFATRGAPGEHVVLELELKILADVGLVGMPNAGKSTFLRAVTGGRAKSEVAAYAFTTLNPVVGVVRVADDGTFEGSVQGPTVFGELEVEEGAERSDVDPEAHRPGHDFDIAEMFRFTIADNPGLVHQASEDVGLGHSFLRSLERSLALVYVVDFAGPEPWEELRVLREELEKYKEGMSGKGGMVLANKADLVGGEHGAEGARKKLERLEEFVREEMKVMIDGGSVRTLDVVPISAKHALNLRKVVGLLRTYVEEARNKLAESRVYDLHDPYEHT